jgi:hypothetical protein
MDEVSGDVNIYYETTDLEPKARNIEVDAATTWHVCE